MTPAQNITRHFRGEWQGSQGAFPTPGHSKSDRGMTVKDAADGDVIFYSHNGGDWRAVKDECRRLGLIPERPRANDNCDGWRDTGSYEYVDADGIVAYRTVRKEKAGQRKRFIAQRPDGRGGWINGLDRDAPRILYRLPEIKAAISRAVLKDEPLPLVYLTEGERKADKLASWGLLATAVAFGAKGWRDAYAEALAGCTVAILPDNDDEGRGFAERAAKSITEAGGRAVIVPLPGLPAKGDVMDWSGDADELRALTDAVLNPPTPMLPLLDPGAWQGLNAPAREWALHEWIPARQATYLTGAGSSGKSLLAQQLATCIALGRPFLGVETRQAVAIYVTCEDDADELHRRQVNICEALGVPLSALSGKLHLVSLAGAIGNELATFDPSGRMATSPAWTTLRATVLATGAGFVALDNVAHLFAGNENIRNQVAAFCGLLNGLATEADASVLFIGHPNKAGDSFSGSTAWENQVRSRIFLDRPRDTDGSVIDPDARTLSRAKANYARNGEALAFRWHQWAFVREGDLPADTRAEMAATIAATAANGAFLRCLAERNKQRRHVSEKPTASNYAPKQFEGMPEAKGFTRKRLEEAMDRLFRIGAIERGFLYRDTAEGKDIHGLREVSAGHPESSPEGSRKELPEGSGNPHKSTGNTPLYTYGISGGAPGVGAPSQEEDDDIDWGDERGEP